MRLRRSIVNRHLPRLIRPQLRLVFESCPSFQADAAEAAVGLCRLHLSSFAACRVGTTSFTRCHLKRKAGETKFLMIEPAFESNSSFAFFIEVFDRHDRSAN